MTHLNEEEALRLEFSKAVTAAIVEIHQVIEKHFSATGLAKKADDGKGRARWIFYSRLANLLWSEVFHVTMKEVVSGVSTAIPFKENQNVQA